jgi:hypothetical protein
MIFNPTGSSWRRESHYSETAAGQSAIHQLGGAGIMGGMRLPLAFSV